MKIFSESLQAYNANSWSSIRSLRCSYPLTSFILFFLEARDAIVLKNKHFDGKHNDTVIV